MNSDEAIEKVLTALRDIEAPPEMERRILQELHHAPTQPQSGWQRLQPIRLTPLACHVATIAIFAITSTLVWTHRHTPSSTQSLQPLKKKTAPTELQSLATAKHPQPLSPKPNPQSTAMRSTRRNNLIRTEDAIALSEMRAPSHPAPPMPLTEQEKLLLRVAHKGDAEELAMLNPEMRTKQETERNAQFHKFFEQTKTGD